MNAAWPQDGGTIVPSEKGQMDRVAPTGAGETEAMRTESLGTSYLALPDGPAPYPGVVVLRRRTIGTGAITAPRRSPRPPESVFTCRQHQPSTYSRSARTS
jgi:hypothetical protein